MPPSFSSTSVGTSTSVVVTRKLGAAPGAAGIGLGGSMGGNWDGGDCCALAAELAAKAIHARNAAE